MSEQDIQEKIYWMLKSKFPFTGVEISVLNRCIDIVYKNEKGELITIEIKLKDWKKAIRQASDHQLYADKSYICMPKPRKGVQNKDLLKSLRASGIGLMWFVVDTDNGSVPYFEEPVRAKRNGSCWPIARKKIESVLYA